MPSVTKGLNLLPSELIPSINVEYQQKQKYGTYKVCVREQSWNAETQLVYDKKRWFAIFPVELYSEKSHSQSIIAYHPGVRSFLTGFDGEKFIDIGNRDITRIFRLGQHIDKLIRAKTTLKGRKNKYKRHQISQIDEVHRKVAKWLTTEPERYFYSYF